MFYYYKDAADYNYAETVYYEDALSHPVYYNNTSSDPIYYNNSTSDPIYYENSPSMMTTPTLNLSTMMTIPLNPSTMTTSLLTHHTMSMMMNVDLKHMQKLRQIGYSWDEPHPTYCDHPTEDDNEWILEVRAIAPHGIYKSALFFFCSATSSLQVIDASHV